MNPDDPKTQKQIQVAYKGLGQLRMYDTLQLVSAKLLYNEIAPIVLDYCKADIDRILYLTLCYYYFRARVILRVRIGR